MTTLTISTSGIPTIKPTYGRFPVSSYSSTPDPWSSPVEFDISLGNILLSTDGSSGAGVFVNDFTATWTPPSSYTAPDLSFYDRIKIQVSADNTITYAPKHFRESVLSINNTVPFNLVELRKLDGTRRQYKIARAISSNVSASSGGGENSAITDIQTWY